MRAGERYSEMKSNKDCDSSSDSSVSSCDKEKMVKLLKFFMKSSNKKKKRKERKFPFDVEIRGKRSEGFDSVSEASDKRHKIGSNVWKYGKDGGVDFPRDGITISMDEYRKLKGQDHCVHQEAQFRHRHEEPPRGFGYIPKFGQNQMSRDKHGGGNEYRSNNSDSRVARLPSYRRESSYHSKPFYQERDRSHRYRNNGPHSRSGNRERFRGDNRSRKKSYSMNQSQASRSSVIKDSFPPVPVVYYVSMNDKQMIRNRLKLSFGCHTIEAPDPKKIYPGIERMGNGDLINPLRHDDKFIKPVIDFVLSHAKEGLKKKVPTMHDTMTFLFLLNDQVHYLTDFKALVTSCRDLSYKLWYNVCEKREILSNEITKKKNWSSLIVYDYDPNNYYATNIIRLLNETAQMTFEQCIKLDEFSNENHNEGVSFYRGHGKKSSDYSGHACGCVQEAVSSQKVQGTERAEDIADMEIDEDKDTKAKVQELNCYEEEKKNIEKDFLMLEGVMNSADFCFNVHVPEEEGLDNYIQSVHHNSGEEGLWDWYLEINGNETSSYVNKDVRILKYVLKKSFSEEKQRLLSLVEFDIMNAQEEEDVGYNEEELKVSNGSNYAFKGFSRPLPTARRAALTKFFNATKSFLEVLPCCIEHDVAVMIDNLEENDACVQCSYCPCSKEMAIWRDKCGFTLDKNYTLCKVGEMYPYELMKHMWEKKDSCMFHQTCLNYLMFKYNIKSYEEYIEVSQLRSKNR